MFSEEKKVPRILIERCGSIKCQKVYIKSTCPVFRKFYIFLLFSKFVDYDLVFEKNFELK